MSIVSCTRRPLTFSRGGSYIRASRGSRSSSSTQGTGQRPVFFSVTTTATFSPISAVSRLHSRVAASDSAQFRVRNRLTSITASSTYIAYASRPSSNRIAMTSSRIAPAQPFHDCSSAARLHASCSTYDAARSSSVGTAISATISSTTAPAVTFRSRLSGLQDHPVRQHGAGDLLHVVGQHVVAAAHGRHRLRRAEQGDRRPRAAAEADVVVLRVSWTICIKYRRTLSST